MSRANMQDGLLPLRHPTGDFFVCDVFDASPKDDLGTMEHPIFSLSTKPDRRVISYAHNGVSIDIIPSVRGRATIHDKDILIYCISQLMVAINGGHEVSRTVILTAHDLLVATNRDTSGDSYQRLKEAFERLAGTRVTTNLETGGFETTRGFGLIESWEIIRRSRGGRMINVTVTLSDWLYRAVLSKSVLTLNRDYFRLRKPLERRIYELARKHCGRQLFWRVRLDTLHKKSGSAAPLRVFRAAVRRMITEGRLPDYTLEEEPDDIIRVVRQGSVIERMSSFEVDVLDAARALAPGWDVYALEAEWREYWTITGQPRLSSPEKAFLGWIKTRLNRAG